MLEQRTEFTVGEHASLPQKVITDEAIHTFAALSGDANPIHVDEQYACETRFGGRIAHGLLVAGEISALLGTKLPGLGSIYLSQDLRFKAPVRPGDAVTAHGTVIGWNGTKGIVTLNTELINQDGVSVITGEAKLIMSSFLEK